MTLTNALQDACVTPTKIKQITPVDKPLQPFKIIPRGSDEPSPLISKLVNKKLSGLMSSIQEETSLA